MDKFVNDDAGFLRWCETHRDGFFWNCGVDKDGNVTTVSLMHSAMFNGSLCPHFLNQKHASGLEDNLTGTHGKVCSTDRAELERWAEPYPAGAGQKGRCSRCTGVS